MFSYLHLIFDSSEIHSLTQNFHIVYLLVSGHFIVNTLLEVVSECNIFGKDHSVRDNTTVPFSQLFF